MLEILLFGVIAVAVYLIAHYIVISVEARRGKPLGAWRTVLFFIIFLALILLAMELFPLGGGRG